MKYVLVDTHPALLITGFYLSINNIFSLFCSRSCHLQYGVPCPSLSKPTPANIYFERVNTLFTCDLNIENNERISNKIVIKHIKRNVHMNKGSGGGGNTTTRIKKKIRTIYTRAHKRNEKEKTSKCLKCVLGCA